MYLSDPCSVPADNGTCCCLFASISHLKGCSGMLLFTAAEPGRCTGAPKVAVSSGSRDILADLWYQAKSPWRSTHWWSCFSLSVVISCLNNSLRYSPTFYHSKPWLGCRFSITFCQRLRCSLPPLYWVGTSKAGNCPRWYFGFAVVGSVLYCVCLFFLLLLLLLLGWVVWLAFWLSQFSSRWMLYIWSCPP